MNNSINPEKREVKVNDWIAESMRLTFDNIGPHLLVGLIICAIALALTATVIGQLLLVVPLWCGNYVYAKNRMLSRPAEIGDLFRGFEIFVEAMIANLIMAVVVIVLMIVDAIGFVLPSLIIGVIGSCCPVAFLATILVWIPAIIITPVLAGIFFGMHALVPGLLWERRLSAMDAIKTSYNFAFKNFWMITLYGTLVMVILMLGSVLTCTIGAIVLAPFMMFATTVVYRDWIGFIDSEAGAPPAQASTV